MNVALRQLVVIPLLLLIGAVPKPSPNASYRVETISMPAGLSAETGAIEFLPNGQLVAAFHRGEVMIYTPETRQWRLFAEGLHEPLGILVSDRPVVCHWQTT